MTEALKTHIAMLPELPEGFAWEVGEPEWRYGSRKADPAFVAITTNAREAPGFSRGEVRAATCLSDWPRTP